MITDLKDASRVFNLINDGPEPTIRFFDFSQVFDDVTQKSYKINELENYDNLTFDRVRTSHFFTLKYKPQDADLSAFIEKCQMGGLKPFLETSASDVNQSNYKEFFDKQRFSVLEVYGTKCAGCKQVEPLLTTLQQNLGVPVAKIDILNEVPFLADIERTPTFLIFDSKKTRFHEVNLEDEDDDGSLLDILTSRISKKL